MLTAIGQNVVVKIVEKEKVTKGGLYLGGQTNVSFQTAEILSLGGADSVAGLKLKVGDTILVAQFYETDMKDKDGGKIAIVHYENIAAKVDKA